MTGGKGQYPKFTRSATLWRVAQAITLVVTLALVYALVVTPESALGLLWNVAIPVLPATFLVTPIIWRSICPLATANMLSNGLVGRRRLGRKAARSAGLVGLFLLAVLVPARLILLNDSGIVMAVLIAALLIGALVTGAFFDAKAGFCNAVCPVLAVERLYGQRPLLNVRNPRCPDCTLCTSRGCIDLAADKALRHAIGPKTSGHRWLLEPYGVFAAAFPGFVLGYFSTDGVVAGGSYLSSVISVYGSVIGYALCSWIVVAAGVRLLRIRSGFALPILAGLAAAIYYWFASVTTAGYLGGGESDIVAIRVAALALIAWWLLRGLRAANRRRDAPVPGAVPVAMEGRPGDAII